MTESSSAPKNPTGRFSDRAEDYAKFRPTYPREAIDAVLEGLGDPGGLLVADVGAGTGISARLLADRGTKVIAIEPNAAMRDAAEAHPRVTFVDGTAERTGLSDQSADLVLCAQSFHWFDPPKALAEFRRILKPDGRVALVWNDRDYSSPMSDAYYKIVLSTPIGRDVSVNWAGENPLIGVAGWKNQRQKFCTLTQRMDWEALLGRALSASYMPKSGPDHERIVRELRELHIREAGPDGTAAMQYLTKVFLAEKE